MPLSRAAVRCDCYQQAGTATWGPVSPPRDDLGRAIGRKRCMTAFDSGSLYSASDLLGFLGCQHKTFLDCVALQTPLVTAQEDAQARLFQEKGKEHELHYLQHLRTTGLHVVEIPEERTLHDRVAQTVDAMRQGVDVIYQAALLHAPWHGFADFLRRVDRPSPSAAFSYEAVDTQ